VVLSSPIFFFNNCLISIDSVPWLVSSHPWLISSLPSLSPYQDPRHFVHIVSARHLHLIFRGPCWLAWYASRQSSSRRSTTLLRWPFFLFILFHIATLKSDYSISFILVFWLESPIATLYSRTDFIAFRSIRSCVRDILTTFPSPTFIDRQFYNPIRYVLIIELLHKMPFTGSII
jgi:hypothetical protein